MDALLTEYQNSDVLKYNLEESKVYSSTESADITAKYNHIIKETD